MRNGLFAKLALVNIKKNHQTYVPYILASLFDVANAVYDAVYQQ